jgi:hypothetical protein
MKFRPRPEPADVRAQASPVFRRAKFRELAQKVLSNPTPPRRRSQGMKSVAEILGVAPPATKSDQAFGTRNQPREFLTAMAAVTFCRESGHALWARLPMYAGKFRIWPGGRKEFYPDKDLGVG